MSEEEYKRFFGLYKTRIKEIREKNKYLGKYKYVLMNDYDNFKDLMSECVYLEIKRKIANRKNQRYRANKKLNKIQVERYDHPLVVFGTLTFNEDQFYKKNGKPIKEETRTKKIDKWIKENLLYAVVNIDYGKKNEREHHHFIGILKDNTILSDTGKTYKGHKLYTIEDSGYDLGYHTIEIVRNNTEDLKNKKISNYLLKINNHINKKSTKNRRFRVINNIDKKE